MAGTTAFPVEGQMASFSTRKKIERNNMSLLDHNRRLYYPCAPFFLLTLKSALGVLAEGRPTSSPY